MKKRKRRRNEHQVVVVEQVSAPDAEERLRRAFDVILRAAARAEEAVIQKTPDHVEKEEDNDNPNPG